MSLISKVKTQYNNYMNRTAVMLERPLTMRYAHYITSLVAASFLGIGIREEYSSWILAALAFVTLESGLQSVFNYRARKTVAQADAEVEAVVSAALGRIRAAEDAKRINAEYQATQK